MGSDYPQIFNVAQAFLSPSLDLRENRELAAETKFRVPQPVAEQMRAWARARMSPDPNARDGECDAYHITSLYFDTEQFDVFHRNGSFGRSKYRIRRYGASGIAFLERKLKTRGLVTKRRTAVQLGELERLAGAEPERGWNGYWYHQRLLARRLAPVCEIAYRRTARVAMTSSGPIRLTLDHDIRALPASGLIFDGVKAGMPLSSELVIVEMKYRMQMPALFKELVEQFALNPEPVSKYRMAVVALGFAREPELKPATQAPSVPSICPTS